jgi:hypothetical protein
MCVCRYAIHKTCGNNISLFPFIPISLFLFCANSAMHLFSFVSAKICEEDHRNVDTEDEKYIYCVR